MKKRINRYLFIYSATGIASLIWFLSRVIPKPSRAAYPCMRAAAPIAGSFVCWLLAALSSLVAFNRAKLYLKNSRQFIAAACIICGLIAAVLVIGLSGSQTYAQPPESNMPQGEAKGIFPGRVVWVHDTDVTDWAGPGNGHWWEAGHINQTILDNMLSRTIFELTGKSTDAAAWDAIFRYFNKTHGRPDTGYIDGEKIIIKVNFVSCINRPDMWCGVDSNTYNMYKFLDYPNTAPQVIISVLRHLVHVLGMNQTNITVGDPTTYFPNQYYNIIHAEFPDIDYLDNQGKFGRTKAQHSSIPLYWSVHPQADSQDYVPLSYVQADYLINIANFKSHGGAGVTLCAKNHYGSLIRFPDDSGYYDMHQSLCGFNPDSGQYRALVDLMGHAHLGGKTLLYLLDGLYAGTQEYDGKPRKWDYSPFRGDWTSSLFASLDPVAIECLALDIMQEEDHPDTFPKSPGAYDHLREAAMADNPPSGTFYDPDNDGDVSRLPSLGVFEHWNNSVDMKYSRNLDSTASGIELVFIDEISDGIEYRPHHILKQSKKTPSISAANPFYLHTAISFTVYNTSTVTLSIYDILGRPVRTLYKGMCVPGSYDVLWNGISSNGKIAASGYYYVILMVTDPEKRDCVKKGLLLIS